MVLENFSFITEEASAQEDREWKAGPSRRQIRDIADAFCKFSRSTAYMPISSVLDCLVPAIPPPLGSKVPAGADGARDPAEERALRRLVRAELNLALRRRAARPAPGAGWVREALARWRALGSCAAAGEGGRCLFANGVSFREALTALALWRKPAMMPSGVRRAHLERLPDVVRTACALVIADFLRGAAARRHLGRGPGGAARPRAPSALAGEPLQRPAAAASWAVDTEAAAAARGSAGFAVPAADPWALSHQQVGGAARGPAALPQQAGMPARVRPYRADATPQPPQPVADCAPALPAGRPRRLLALRPLAGMPGAPPRPSPQAEGGRAAGAAAASAAPPAAGAVADAAAGAGADWRARRAVLRPLPGGGPGGTLRAGASSAGP